MSRSSRLSGLGSVACLVAALACPGAVAQSVTATKWQGIGRPATPAEIRAWDIDVRPDFKGLPPGSGSVAKGQDIWEAKCASCHGVFGESNEVFPPIVGGTTREDMRSGRVMSLSRGTEAQRSTMMKISSLSTLWDYIHRAMPWNNPRTLTIEEVYAVTAYILNLAEILPADFILSDRNIREVQAMLPNREGTMSRHGLWLPSGKPDVRSVACMRDCAVEPKITSALPEHARGSHGNLADQTRNLGGLRGQVTTAATTAATSAASEFAAVKELTGKAACLGCHGVDRKIVGPGFNDVGAKYKTSDQAETYLAGKIKGGGQGVWGAVPMPPTSISEGDARLLARWILKGAPE